jgi:hypothetical protein
MLECQMTSHLEIDPILGVSVNVEEHFRDAVYRLELSKLQCKLFVPMNLLLPGTLITFTGYPFTEGHHVLTWTQVILENDIYLRVVGRRTSDLTPYPYDDPRFPTIILKLPARLALAMYPPGMRPEPPSLWARLKGLR